MQMSPEARRQLASSALSQLNRLDLSEPGIGEQAMQGNLQPLFALSGYRLRAEGEVRGKYRFDLIGEKLLDGDDRLLVEFKFTRDGAERVMVPETSGPLDRTAPAEELFDRRNALGSTAFTEALTSRRRNQLLAVSMVLVAAAPGSKDPLINGPTLKPRLHR